MRPVNIEEAQSKFYDLLLQLTPGEDVVILAGGQPVAKLVRLALEPQTPREAGSAKRSIHWMAPDFDAPLDDFEEYMD